MMSVSSFIGLLFIVSFSLSSVSCFSTGSPICRAVQLSDVASMGSVLDGSSEGFILTASSTTYIPNQLITFNITNGRGGFIGFLAFVEQIGATSDHIKQVGSFIGRSDTTFPTAAACAATKSAITHSNRGMKPLPFTFQWIAPSSPAGQLKARLAIVAGGDRKFQFLSLDLSEATTTTTTTTTTPTTTTNTPPSTCPTPVVPSIVSTSVPESATTFTATMSDGSTKKCICF